MDAKRGRGSSQSISMEDDKSPSFRVLYYGGAAGAVPFMWESQPGTPKHAFSTETLPPLTPPPAYHFQSNLSHSISSMEKHLTSRTSLLYAIFARHAGRKNHVSVMPKSKSVSSSSSPFYSSSSSSSSSWSYASPTKVMNGRFRRGCFSKNPRSPHAFWEDGEEAGLESPYSTIGFSGGTETRISSRARHSLKNAFLSIVGCGSRRGTAQV